MGIPSGPSWPSSAAVPWPAARSTSCWRTGSSRPSSSISRSCWSSCSPSSASCSARRPATSSALGGRPAVDRWGKYLLLTHKDLDRAEAWFDRHGDPWSCSAGSSRCCGRSCPSPPAWPRWPSPSSSLFTVIGCAVWCTALSLLGYSLGWHLRQRAEEVQRRHLRHRRTGRRGRRPAVLAPGAHDAGGTELTRGTSAGARKAALQASEHLVRSEAWNGLRAGDPVVVAGLPMRGATWEFRAHVVNTNNGTESIEVVGGRPGDRTIRSFGPERIFAATGRARGARPRPWPDSCHWPRRPSSLSDDRPLGSTHGHRDLLPRPSRRRGHRHRGHHGVPRRAGAPGRPGHGHRGRTRRGRRRVPRTGRDAGRAPGRRTGRGGPDPRRRASGVPRLRGQWHGG